MIDSRNYRIDHISWFVFYLFSALFCHFYRHYLQYEVDFICRGTNRLDKLRKKATKLWLDDSFRMHKACSGWFWKPKPHTEGTPIMYPVGSRISCWCVSTAQPWVRGLDRAALSSLTWLGWIQPPLIWSSPPGPSSSSTHAPIWACHFWEACSDFTPAETGHMTGTAASHISYSPPGVISMSLNWPVHGLVLS